MGTLQFRPYRRLPDATGAAATACAALWGLRIPSSKADVAMHICALAVWPSVADGRIHPSDGVFVDGQVAPGVRVVQTDLFARCGQSKSEVVDALERFQICPQEQVTTRRHHETRGQRSRRLLSTVKEFNP